MNEFSTSSSSNSSSNAIGDPTNQERRYKRTFRPWKSNGPVRQTRPHLGLSDGTVKFINIIALGAAGVGKTTLLAHFAYRTVQATRATVAVDYSKVGMFIDHHGAVKKGRGTVVHVVLNLIDSPGDTAFNNFTDRILATAHGCLLVFDASDRASLDALKDVAKRAKRHCARAPRALVANKIDKYKTSGEHWLTEERIREAMLELGCKAFYPLCAKSDLLAIDEMMVLHTEAAFDYTRRLRRETRAHDDIVQLEAPISPRFYRKTGSSSSSSRTHRSPCEC